MPQLNRAVIVDTALAVADQDGLEGVTMRRVARVLGAAPMSLYRHVASKSELLDLMLDHVIQRLVPLSAAGAPWPDAVRALAYEARRLLGEHPAWLPLFTRPIAPRSALVLFERLAAALSSDHVSKQQLDAVTSLMCFTLGFVLVERTMRGTDGTTIPIAQLAAARAATASAPDTYPRLDALGPTFEGWGFDDAFASGLESLLADVRRDRAA